MASYTAGPDCTTRLIQGGRVEEGLFYSYVSTFMAMWFFDPKVKVLRLATSPTICSCAAHTRAVMLVVELGIFVSQRKIAPKRHYCISLQDCSFPPFSFQRPTSLVEANPVAEDEHDSPLVVIMAHSLP